MSFNSLMNVWPKNWRYNVDLCSRTEIIRLQCAHYCLSFGHIQKWIQTALIICPQLLINNIEIRYFRFMRPFQQFTTGMDKSYMVSSWMLATRLKFSRNVALGIEAHVHENHELLASSPNHTFIWRTQTKPIQLLPNVLRCCVNGRKFGSGYMW